MEYVFGIQGKNEMLKTKGDAHTNLSGFQQYTFTYPDQIITHHFHVMSKIRSKEDTEGNCYDWYEIDRHYQVVDKSGALAEKMSESNATLADAICELDMIYESRIARLEDAMLGLDEDLNGGN